jgi:hypothetical protein
MDYRSTITGNEADRQFSEASDAMNRGRDVHDLLGLYDKHCLTNRLTHDDDAGQRFIRQVALEHPRPEALAAEIREIAENYIANTRFDLLSPGEVFGVEEEMWAIFTDDRSGLRVAYNGRLDRYHVNGEHCFVEDKKSTRQIMRSGVFKAEKQLPGYTALLMAQPRFQAVKRGIGAISYPAIDGSYRQEKAITAESVLDFYRWMFDTAAMILHGIERVRAGVALEVAFPPQPGRACELYSDSPCEWASRCPYQAQTQHAAAATADEARALLADYLAGKVINESKFAAAKLWVASNGPIVCNGKVLMPEIKDSAKVLDENALVMHLYETGQLDALQVKSRSLVSLGVATDLAKNLVEQGLVALSREPETNLRNVEKEEK